MTAAASYSLRTVLGAVLVVLLLVAGVVMLWGDGSAYRVQFLMPTATDLVVGDRVLVKGEVAGSVHDVEVHNNRDALVTVDLDDGYAPLHQGTTARIVWSATIRERNLQIEPGPPAAPVLPSGARVLADNESVELDDVLATLDPATMKDVNGLVQQLSASTKGREKDLSATLRTAGPTVDALGEVLKAVAQDGPALRQLVTRLHDVTATLVARKQDLGGAVRDLDPVTRAIADQQQKLSQTVNELPSTLSQAKTTLDKVPAAVDETVPLLKDLKPATAQLPETAANLRPILADLRPLIKELRPTLRAADDLLGKTPSLIDDANAVVPPLTETVGNLRPAVAFLRPYIPEATGWLANWTSVFGNQTFTGTNFANILITGGQTAVNANPGFPLPGYTHETEPLPGSTVKQPWTDANGDTAR